MIFNMSGGGGGSGGLFYDVACQAAEPAKKEGRIWVKSSVPMTHFEFSPIWGGAGIGAVAIQGNIGGANPLPTNNVLEVFQTKRKGIPHRMKASPASCMQVQGTAGNWVNVDAYVCHSNTWVQFSYTRLYLYKNGDPCNTNTGGWRSDNGSGWLTTGTYNINDNGNIYLKGNNSGLWVHTINAVDITAFKTLNAVISYAKGKRNALSVFAPTTTWNMDGDLSRKEISASGTATLDISALTGPHFIGVGTHSSETVPAEMKVSEVWLS